LMRSWFALSTLAFVVAIAGCASSPCPDLCAALEEAGCATPSCLESCEANRSRRAEIGCLDETDAETECRRMNACVDPTSVCIEESDAVLACLP